MNKQKIARNFMKTRGKSAFRTLIRALEEQRSGQEIGELLGVSRERVRQWRDTFGQTVSYYQVYPEVRDLVNHIEKQGSP